MKNIILKFSGLLLAGHLFNFWLLFYSPLNLPDRIPHTPIKISGLLLIVLIIAILVKFQKSILKFDNQTTLFHLSLLSIIVCFIAEILFQAIRFATLSGDTLNQRLYYCIRGTIVVPLFCTIPSFFIGFQIKTKRTILLLVGIFIFFLIVGLLKNIYPAWFTNDT